MTERYRAIKVSEAKRYGNCTRCYREKAELGKQSCVGCLEIRRAYGRSEAGQRSRKKYEASQRGKTVRAKPRKRDNKEYHEAYRKAHKEYYYEKYKQWRSKNKEKYNEHQRRWREKKKLLTTKDSPNE